MIKNFVRKYFQSFTYFYSYLRYRIFVVLFLSILIGVLDGLGLTMFLPLLQLVNDSSDVDPEGLGKLRFIIDFIEGIGLELDLFAVLTFMVIFFFLKGVVQYIFGIYKVNVQEKFITTIRLNNIRGLNGLSYKFFVMADAGRIQNTLTGEVERVTRAFKTYFKAFQYGIMVSIYMLFAFSIDAQFALLVSIGGVLTNFLYKSLYKQTKGFSRKLTGDSNNFQSLIIQNVTNFKYLKATGSLRRYEKKLSNAVKEIEKSNIKIGKLDAILNAGREPILVSVVVSVIFIQTTLLNSPLGPILISLIFFYRALIYLMQMQVEWNAFLAVSGSMENMTSFEKDLKKNREHTGNEPITNSVHELVLNNISFSYNETSILNNISLKIKEHETVAFVGESGSGKTTLVNILAGLLPVQEGTYLINGKRSNEVDLTSLQEKIGYITQDPVIFNDSIYNNVTFWAEKNPENLTKFNKAIKQAAISDFISTLSNQEYEVLGNNGLNLSGGQKQRISIARELYKDVSMLILDEATSALDSETEKAIQENIDDLKGRYTILIVAHRISTIKNADKIVVLKNGEISFVSNFDNLLTESRYFKKLVDLQGLNS